jgi:hypothetical protein
MAEIFFPDRHPFTIQRVSYLRLIDKEMNELFKSLYVSVLNTFSAHSLPGLHRYPDFYSHLKSNSNKIANLNLVRWKLTSVEIDSIFNECSNLKKVKLYYDDNIVKLSHRNLSELTLVSHNLKFNGECLSGCPHLSILQFKGLTIKNFILKDTFKSLSFKNSLSFGIDASNNHLQHLKLVNSIITFSTPLATIPHLKLVKSHCNVNIEKIENLSLNFLDVKTLEIEEGAIKRRLCSLP